MAQSLPARLEGRVAIVTGAAQGIGEATARRLAVEGARVLCVDRNPSVTGVADEIGDAALAMVGDLKQASALGTIVERANSRWGRVDVLVNNAGIDGTPALLADRLAHTETFCRARGNRGGRRVSRER